MRLQTRLSDRDKNDLTLFEVELIEAKMSNYLMLYYCVHVDYENNLNKRLVMHHPMYFMSGS